MYPAVFSLTRRLSIVSLYFLIALPLRKGLLVSPMATESDSAYDLVKIEDRSLKRSHKLNNRSRKDQNVSTIPDSVYDSVAKEHSHGSTVWKVSPKFFSFVVYNPCQSSPSLNILLPFWLIIISFVFVYLCIVLFSVFLQFRGSFVDGQNKSKYHDYAPLILDHCRRKS